MGKNFLVGKLNSKISNIDMAELPEGVYFLIIGGNLKQVIKVIKK